MAGVTIQTIVNWVEAGLLEAEIEWQGTKAVRKIPRESLEKRLAHIEQLKVNKSV